MTDNVFSIPSQEHKAHDSNQYLGISDVQTGGVHKGFGLPRISDGTGEERHLGFKSVGRDHHNVEVISNKSLGALHRQALTTQGMLNQFDRDQKVSHADIVSPKYTVALLLSAPYINGPDAGGGDDAPPANNSGTPPGSMPVNNNGDNNGNAGGGSPSSNVSLPIANDDLAFEMIKGTPTGASELKQLEDDGWHFYWTSEDTSHTDNDHKAIVLSDQYKNNPQLSSGQLAHELGHATNNIPVDESSRSNFINTEMYNEGAATANNIKISLEAGESVIPIQGSPNLIGTYKSEYDDGVRAGDMSVAYKEIGATMGTSEITGGGQPYADMYGSWYDAQVASGRIVPK